MKNEKRGMRLRRRGMREEEEDEESDLAAG